MEVDKPNEEELSSKAPAKGKVFFPGDKITIREATGRYTKTRIGSGILPTIKIKVSAT